MCSKKFGLILAKFGLRNLGYLEYQPNLWSALGLGDRVELGSGFGFGLGSRLVPRLRLLMPVR